MAVEIKKVICEACGIEKNLEKNYYLSRLPNQERMVICKDCFVEEIRNTEKIFDVLKKYNIPFLYELWDSSYIKHCELEATIGEYMSKINSLPQYRNLKWKDSILNSSSNTDDKKEVNFYDDIVTNLQKEAKKLNIKLTKISDSNGDYNSYISILKSLRETLELISKYDWQIHYSEYTTGLLEGSQKQISIWEQNHDNQIRNHKIWNIREIVKKLE